MADLQHRESLQKVVNPFKPKSIVNRETNLFLAATELKPTPQATTPQTTTELTASELTFRPVTVSQIFAMSAWRYSAPYDLYNLFYPPDSEDVAYWLDPSIHVQAILNGNNLLVAFCTFGLDGQVPGGNYSAEALDIGMGVRPDLTGQSHGLAFAEAVCEFGCATFQPQMLRVTVASRNKRAMKVWTKKGFRPNQQFLATKTDMSFDILTLPVSPSSPS